MITEKPVQQLMEELYAAWSSWDVSRLLPLFTDDVVYEDVALGIVCRGKDEFRAFAERFFAAGRQVTFQLTSTVVGDGRVSAEWAAGQHRCVSVMDLEGGLIKRCSDYYDLVTMARLNGVLSETLVVAPRTGMAEGRPRRLSKAAKDRARPRARSESMRRGETMSLEENKALMTRWVEGMNRHDPGIVDETCAPGWGSDVGGHEAVKNLLADYFAGFPDGVWTITDMIAEGEWVATRYTFAGTNTGEFQGRAATGNTVASRGIWIDQIRDGKFVGEAGLGLQDRLALLTQLGIVTPP